MRAHYSRFKIATLLLVFLLPFSCSKDNSNPAGPGNDDDITIKVLETKQGAVTADGASIALADGASVVFPAGAVTASATVTVKKIDPVSWFEADATLGRVVIGCEGITGTLAQPAVIRVPLPQAITPADSLKISAGLIDDETGAVHREPCAIQVIDGKPFAVMQVTHFSNRVFEWIVGANPPESYTSLVIPYYNQGSSQYCWATSVQMITEAVSHDDNDEIADIIGVMGVDEGGITSYTFRYSSTLASLIRQRTGATPDRGTWDYVNINQMRTHLKREIGVRHHPVALFNGVWSHAVVVVGYDGDTFYIQDPASTTPSTIGYTTRTWTDIAGKIDALTNMVTLSIPVDLAQDTAPIRVNISPQAFRFLKPQTGPEDLSAVYNYSWDYTVATGYSFRDQTDTIDPLPGTVQKLTRSGDIEITNASLTIAQSVSVWLDITSLGPLGNHYSAQKTVQAGPNTLVTAPFEEVLVDEFRENQSGNTEYLLTVSALVGGTVRDKASIQFTISPVTPKITSITPNTGGAGSVVTIAGKNLGLLKKNNQITFNGAKADSIVSWKDSEIKVLAPAGVKTGPVVVKRGTVASNGVQFTVSEETTVTGDFSESYSGVFNGSVLSMSGTWSFTGTGAKVEYGSDGTPYLSVKTGTQAVLDIALDAAMDPEVVSYPNSDGSRTEIRYLTPKPQWMRDDYTVQHSGGEFPMDYTASQTSYRLSFTLEKNTQHVYVDVAVGVDAQTTEYDAEGKVKYQYDPHYANGRTLLYFSIEAD